MVRNDNYLKVFSFTQASKETSCDAVEGESILAALGPLQCMQCARRHTVGQGQAERIRTNLRKKRLR